MPHGYTDGMNVDITGMYHSYKNYENPYKRMVIKSMFIGRGPGVPTAAVAIVSGIFFQIEALSAVLFIFILELHVQGVGKLILSSDWFSWL